MLTWIGCQVELRLHRPKSYVNLPCDQESKEWHGKEKERKRGDWVDTSKQLYFIQTLNLHFNKLTDKRISGKNDFCTAVNKRLFSRWSVIFSPQGDNWCVYNHSPFPSHDLGNLCRGLYLISSAKWKNTILSNTFHNTPVAWLIHSRLRPAGRINGFT